MIHERTGKPGLERAMGRTKAVRCMEASLLNSGFRSDPPRTPTIGPFSGAQLNRPAGAATKRDKTSQFHPQFADQTCPPSPQNKQLEQSPPSVVRSTTPSSTPSRSIEYRHQTGSPPRVGLRNEWPESPGKAFLFRIPECLYQPSSCPH